MEYKFNYENLTEQAARIKREFPILDYFFELEKKGFLRFDGKKGKEYFFGFEHQRTGSIAVSESANLWFDHSIGNGGDIIKAVQVFEGKTFVEAIEHLGKQAPVENVILPEKPEKERNHYKIIKVLETIEHPALINYIRSRGLDPIDFCGLAKEIHWLKEDRRYFGIGFGNNQGGYAVRSGIFKGNINSGGISCNKVGEKPVGIKIFEGGIDFVSYKRLYPGPSYYAVVLNSTANLTLKLMTAINDKANKLDMVVDLYLDNDTTGDEKTASALQRIGNAKDRRYLYKEFEDLNQFLIKDQQKHIGR